MTAWPWAQIRITGNIHICRRSARSRHQAAVDRKSDRLPRRRSREAAEDGEAEELPSEAEDVAEALLKQTTTDIELVGSTESEQAFDQQHILVAIRRAKKQLNRPSQSEMTKDNGI